MDGGGVCGDRFDRVAVVAVPARAGTADGGGHVARARGFHDCTLGHLLRDRAQQVTGNAWAEDPGCYLTDEEIGFDGSGERVETTAYSSRRKVIDLVHLDS